MNAEQVNLETFVEEIDAQSPLCLVSAPGFDASHKVENLATEMKMKEVNKFASVAIGGPETFKQAD
jgi:dynein heavy chain 1